MKLKTLETVANQVQSTAKNLANNAVSSVKREFSITKWANRLLASVAKRRPPERKRKGEGVYILSAEEVQKGRRLDQQNFVAPDGYVRKSPVQEIVEDPAYRRRLIWRAVCGALCIGAAALVLYVLVDFGIIGF